MDRALNVFSGTLALRKRKHGILRGVTGVSWQSVYRAPGWLVGYATALVGVTLVSLFIGLVFARVNLANISMLYLLAVMAAAVAFGRGPAIFASISAFLIFDWFF